MTTESAPRIKITYATLRADNEELHSQFEAGHEAARTSLGGYHRNYVDGAWRDGDGTFEVRSPIDTDVADRHVRPRDTGRHRRCRRGGPGRPARMGRARLARAASRSSSAPPTSSASG